MSDSILLVVRPFVQHNSTRPMMSQPINDASSEKPNCDKPRQKRQSGPPWRKKRQTASPSNRRFSERWRVLTPLANRKMGLLCTFMKRSKSSTQSRGRAADAQGLFPRHQQSGPSHSTIVVNVLLTAFIPLVDRNRTRSYNLHQSPRSVSRDHRRYRYWLVA